METINISVTLTKREYIRAARKFLVASGTISRLNIFLVPTSIAVAVLFIINSGLSLFSFLLLLAGVVLLIIGCTVYFYIPGDRYKLNPLICDKHKYKITAEYIAVKGSYRQVLDKWDFLSDIWKSYEFYFLVYKNGDFSVIPARCMTVTTEAGFLRIAARKVNKIKKI